MSLIPPNSKNYIIKVFLKLIFVTEKIVWEPPLWFVGTAEETALQPGVLVVFIVTSCDSITVSMFRFTACLKLAVL